MPNEKGTCFVVMGFGKQVDFESGRTLDLDRSYRNMIKPAVEGAGFKCIRADEIVHSGLIDVQMYQQLLGADIVVADLSTSNKNAFYELGIRHALRPYNTIVIAEEGMKAPFDVNHVVVRSYRHLGEDIGFDEVMRFRGLLTDAIATITAQPTDQRVDSPVYRFLKGLAPPRLGKPVPATPAQPAPPSAAPAAAPTHSALMQQVKDAIADFVLARRVCKEVIEMCEKWLADNPPPAAQTATAQALKQDAENRYWVLATVGEAMVGLGDPAAQQQLDKAFAATPAGWMADSTREQIAKLRTLLADSPLKHLKPVA